MALLTASDLRKDIAGQPLLRGVSFKLERRERLTLAGRNGAGKTTLLRMLAGESSIDGGELSVAKGVRIALHDQRPPRERGGTLEEYLLSGCAEELAIEDELAKLERAMADDGGDEATLTRYAAAQARLETRGGYLWRNRASDTAHGLGFRDDDLQRTLDTFSGGELTRASLARALATGADVLLLDEPTNHLDIASLEWLEQALAALDAAVVLVAHDRWFLEAVGTAVLELQAGRSRFFAGSWHNWRREQAARELELGRAITAQQAEIERTERFIERFRYKATKAKQAQSRIKRLDKMERLERDPRDGRGLEFAFSTPQRSGRVIFELHDGRVEVGGDGERRQRVRRDRPGDAARARRDVAGTGRARVARGTQRGRQDDPRGGPCGPPGAAGGQALGRSQREGRLPLPARGGAGGGRPARADGRGSGPARHRPHPEQGAGAARPFPVLRRGGRETARRAVRRRAPAAVAGGARRRRPPSERPDPRRAHQPPRPREPRGAGGRPARVPRRDPARVPRPCPARRGRNPHRRRRGRDPPHLPRRLGRVRPHARGTPGRRWAQGGADGAPSRPSLGGTARNGTGNGAVAGTAVGARSGGATARPPRPGRRPSAARASPRGRRRTGSAPSSRPRWRWKRPKRR